MPLVTFVQTINILAPQHARKAGRSAFYQDIRIDRLTRGNVATVDLRYESEPDVGIEVPPWLELNVSHFGDEYTTFINLERCYPHEIAKIRADYYDQMVRDLVIDGEQDILWIRRSATAWARFEDRRFDDEAAKYLELSGEDQRQTAAV